MGDSKLKVLVVDDLRSMRTTLAGVIEDQGYDVTEVEDGYQAIEAVTNARYDLVFMDIKMPGINGVQTFREIKKIRPEAVVVMMTGFAVEDLVASALEEGAFSVIYKPFDVDEVVRLAEVAFRSALILVVDDRASDRELLSDLLTERGHSVFSAASGDEAIEMVRDHRYDVILMDIKLPGQDGVSTFEQIRAIDPNTKVLFITGFDLEETMKQALDAGAYAVAYKPVDVERILGLVRRAMAEAVR